MGLPSLIMLTSSESREMQWSIQRILGRADLFQPYPMRLQNMQGYMGRASVGENWSLKNVGKELIR